MIPKSVIIGGIEHDIVEINQVIVGDKANMAGSYSLKDCRIELFSDASEKYKELVLAHEIFHGILSAAGYNLNEQEETFVLAMERAFYQFIKDNTDFYSGE